MIDTVPSSQRGLLHLLRRSSLCSEGKDVQLLSRSPLAETRPSPLISIAIWGRDVRIVVLTGLFWMANLAGSFYGKNYFVFAFEVLILLSIALTQVLFLISSHMPQWC